MKLHVLLQVSTSTSSCNMCWILLWRSCPVELAQDNYTLTAFVQEDGKQAIAPRHYIEPLTHRLTSVAKKVPCLSKFFARYKDIFGHWFAVMPHIATTEPPGTLDLETIHKKVRFDTSSDIDLSQRGVYDPDAVDALISWLEGNRRPRRCHVPVGRPSWQP